jgi:hypothetical protein
MQALTATGTDFESMDRLLQAHTDITGAVAVEVSARDDGTVLWVNVNGVCVLRICRIQSLSITKPGETP